LHYAQHAFPGLKSIKNFGPPTLRFAFGPSTSNALAPALVVLQLMILIHGIKDHIVLFVEWSICYTLLQTYAFSKNGLFLLILKLK